MGCREGCQPTRRARLRSLSKAKASCCKKLLQGCDSHVCTVSAASLGFSGWQLIRLSCEASSRPSAREICVRWPRDLQAVNGRLISVLARLPRSKVRFGTLRGGGGDVQNNEHGGARRMRQVLSVEIRWISQLGGRETTGGLAPALLHFVATLPAPRAGAPRTHYPRRERGGGGVVRVRWPATSASGDEATNCQIDDRTNARSSKVSERNSKPSQGRQSGKNKSCARRAKLSLLFSRARTSSGRDDNITPRATANRWTLDGQPMSGRDARERRGWSFCLQSRTTQRPLAQTHRDYVPRRAQCRLNSQMRRMLPPISPLLADAHPHTCSVLGRWSHTTPLAPSGARGARPQDSAMVRF